MDLLAPPPLAAGPPPVFAPAHAPPGPASQAPLAPLPVVLGLALAVGGPVACGALLAARTGAASPLAATPAIVFGVLAATGPALYIATAAVGGAPPLGRVLRGFVTGLGAFGIALAGLLLPAVFLALSSLAPATTVIVVTAALAGAAGVGLRRLAAELGPLGMGASLVFLGWAAATLGIAGRLWLDLAREVLA